MPPTRSITAPVGTPVREYWEAETCGTHYIDAEKFTREYFDSIEAFRYRLEPFIHDFVEFPRWKDTRCLEIGVGAGTDFLQFLRAGADMSGIDLTDAAVEHVRHRAAVYGFPPPDVRRAVAEQLPFADATFDLVYSWGVLHHCADDAKAFDEMYRVTKPGGMIKIMVYNLNSTNVWLKWIHHAIVERQWKLGPRAGRRWALARFHQSGGTKGYTERQFRDWLRSYPHSNPRFRFDAVPAYPGDRYAGIFRFLRAVEPSWMRWFLSFEFVKA
jgi:ubiquinone/menaquinone biosynthesis C-methylase UbiE